MFRQEERLAHGSTKTGGYEGKRSATFSELSGGLVSSERVREGVILTDKIGLCTCDNIRLWFNRRGLVLISALPY